MPLMKRLESAFENSLEMSIASLMDTTGGMSLRWSISNIAMRRIARSIFAIRSKSQFWASTRICASMPAWFLMTPSMISSPNA